MAKSRGRKLAELVAPTNGVFAAASIPTIALSKLANSTFSVNSESASLGGNVVLDSNDVTEHSSALYFTNARAQGSLSVAANSGHGALSYDNSNGQFTFAGITTEAIQDVVGAMFSSNTETAVTVTYQDSDGTVDLIVDDTTKVPLAGGTMTGNLTLGDNVNAYFGASTDLRIYHDGTNSHIINSTGELRFTGSNFAIKSDSAKLYFGTSDDLQIYHDGSNSYINDTGTGALFLKTSYLAVAGANGNQLINAEQGAAVELYHNNAKKLETNSGGVTVTGTAILGGATFVDNATAYFGTGLDLRIYHDGGNSYIKNNTGWLNMPMGGSGVSIANSDFSESIAKFVVNGACELYYDGGKKLETTSTGVQTTGTLNVNGAFAFPTSDGTNGQVLQTNGSGVVSWSTAAGGGSVWSSSGSDIYYTSGEVGIGINAPTHKLHVKNDNDYAAKFGGTGGGDYSIEIGQTGTNASAGFNATGSSGSMLFKISDSEKMRIKHDGNVGIGTNNPSEKLVIKGTTSFMATNSTNRWMAYTYTDNTFRLNYNGAGADEVTIDSSGNVTAGGTVTTGQVRWGTGNTYSGNPRSVVLGYSGGNYGQLGYGWHPTSTSGQHTSQINDLQSRIDLYDGIVVYGSGSAQSVGSTVGWTELLNCRTNVFTYKGNTIWHAGNDGASSGLDADTLDGVQAANFVRTDAGSTVGNVNITFSGTPASSNIIRFDNAAGASIGTSGSYNSRLEMRQPTANADAFMSFHIAGDYAAYFGLDGATNDFAVGGWSMGANKYKVWHAGNDGTGSGLDADLLDGQEGAVYFKGYSNVSGWQNSNNNFSVRSGGTAVGLHMEESDGTFGFQLYGDGSNYGFLDGEWANWDIQKATNSTLKIDEGSGLVRVLTSPESNIPSTYFTRGSNVYGVFGGASGANLNTFFTGTPRAGFFDGWSGSNFPSGLTHVHGIQVRHNSGNHYGWQLVGQYNNNGDLRVRNVNNGTFSSWYKVWTANTDGSGSGLDADLLDGYQLNTGRANVANRVVATDGNGYIQSGWINTTSGAMAVATDLARIYCSDDGYIRWMTNSNFKIKMGLSGQTNYDRQNYTSGTTYMTGANSHNDCTYNELLQRGCGFNDNWNSGAGKPPSGSHFNGFTAMHYASGSSYFHGMQMAMSAGNPGTTYLRGWWANGGSGYAWQKIWTDGNDGSGSGLDADLLDGLNAKGVGSASGASLVLTTNTNSYLVHQNWIDIGPAGLYSATTNSAHWYPNNTGSYGTWRMAGSKGGYSGIYHDTGATVTSMIDSSGNGGTYHQGDGIWHFYWRRSHACLGIGNSTTSSSYSAYVNGALYSSGNIVAYSDRRIKENIVPIDSALEKVNKLAGVYYNRIDDKKKTREIGFIAQEVNEVAPELVIYAEDVDQYGVKYGNTTALLVEAVKELTQQVKDLKQELEELKNG